MYGIIKNPPLFFIISLLGFILIGSLSLGLAESIAGNSLPVSELVFTATSAVTVTGLTVHNTADFSFASKIVILVLIQIGGIGIMTFFGLFLTILKRKWGMSAHMAFKDILDRDFITELKGLLNFIITFTFIVELTGAVLYFLYFIQRMPGAKAAFFSVFHSVSAFCNAGFILFRDGFIRFQGDWYINILTALLIIVGGLGFTTFIFFRTRILSVLKNKKPTHKIDLTTKVILVSTVFLLFFGSVFLFVFEMDNNSNEFPIQTAFFQATSARTAGFNTINPSDMTLLSRGVITTLMFIGAAPGATSGGIKVTTAFLVILGVISFLTKDNEIKLWGKRIGLLNILRAFSIFVLSLVFVSVSAALLFVFESTTPEDAVFETVSAFATAGFSVGISNNAGIFGQSLLILLMIVGRVGPLSLFFVYSYKKKIEKSGKIIYPEERVIIG